MTRLFRDMYYTCTRIDVNMSKGIFLVVHVKSKEHVKGTSTLFKIKSMYFHESGVSLCSLVCLQHLVSLYCYLLGVGVAIPVAYQVLVFPCSINGDNCGIGRYQA